MSSNHYDLTLWVLWRIFSKSSQKFINLTCPTPPPRFPQLPWLWNSAHPIHPGSIWHLNQGGQADVIIMDFSKAFDKVDHKRFLLKLHRLGISHGVMAWIHSFLSDRNQRVHVVLKFEQSDACSVFWGVVWGSVQAKILEIQKSVIKHSSKIPLLFPFFVLKHHFHTMCTAYNNLSEAYGVPGRCRCTRCHIGIL